MVARKIFHVLVGFWFASNAFSLLYFIGAAFYLWLTDRLDENGPLFFMLPRFAMIISAPLPRAAGIVMWRARRYVALGVMAFGAVAFVFWMTVRRVDFW